MFEVSKELAALQSLTDTTTGEDIFCKVCQTMEELDLDWSKLASITTDGAPSMIGASQGLAGCIKKKWRKDFSPPPLQVQVLPDSPASTVLKNSGNLSRRWLCLAKTSSEQTD